MRIIDVEKELATDSNKGLSSSEAVKRRQRYGLNEVVRKHRKHAISMFFSQFSDFMVLILIGATAVSAWLGEVEDAITIMCIVLLNAILGFFQEFKAEKSLEALKRLSAPSARVIRSGKNAQLPAMELVPGDVIIVEAGDRVPADARLVETSSLQAEESALTGESLPVNKDACAILAGNLPLGDRVNMVYSGTAITQGRGRAVVVATGMTSELGRIAQLVNEAQEEDTPLQRRLARLGKWLVSVCLLLCALVVAAGMMRGESWERMFLTGVSLAVAAIPEGLPAIVTIALAIGVQRMIARNAIVRRLPAVETLGCTTIICSDKTGTLTRNAMTVTDISLASGNLKVSGNGYEPKGSFELNKKTIKPDEISDLTVFLDVCALCNNASVESDADAQSRALPSISKFSRNRRGQRRPGGCDGQVKWRVSGDPTEGALLTLAMKGGRTTSDSLAGNQRLLEIPFSSERRMMSVAYSDEKRHIRSYVKGAPDVILDRCAYRLQDGRAMLLTGAARTQILRTNEAYAQSALRVIGMAYRDIPFGGQLSAVKDKMESDLVFIGLAGIIDPPREEVKTAIKTARRAGIRTVMITGDHKATALAIADELGLAADLPIQTKRSEHSIRALCGDELDAMTDSRFIDCVDRVHVFARVTPKHKLRIVKALKKKGHIVAMTGDGVNDAPAVKEADIGISMGISGTDVTKEASAMVLADDNYATIIAAVEEGRSIYSNIRKFIRYLLGCNMGEVLSMFLATAAGLPLPLLPMQILWTNLITDGLPALALGVDPSDKNVMDRSPRDPHESILSGGLQLRMLATGVAIALCTLVAFVYGMRGDATLDHGRTMALTTLVMSQLVYVFSCRSENRSIFELGFFTNGYLVLSVGFSLIMQLAVIYMPFFQQVFRTVPLSGDDWLPIVILSGWSLILAGLARPLKRFVSRRLAYVRAS